MKTLALARLTAMIAAAGFCSFAFAQAPDPRPGASTPVQVRNTDANPVPVKILGEVPLIPVPLTPYQSTQTTATCSGNPVHTDCDYTFPAVADSTRLVITNFSYIGLADSSPYKLTLTNGHVTPTSVVPTFTSTRQLFSGGTFFVVNSNQPVLLYVDTGGQPKLTVSIVGGSQTVFSTIATISGYVIDCTVSGCPAIAP